MTTYKIAVFVGSLRKESYNLKIAKSLISLSPESLSLEIIHIGDLPIYNEDLEEEVPSQWKTLRDQIAAADGVLFLTPEYNRSIPAVLKNVIDIGSRPKTNNKWNGKPGGVISVSPGKLGAFGANHQLRQALVPVNIPVMAQPEAYIGEVMTLFDGDDKLINESTGDFLRMFMNEYSEWVARHSNR